MADPVGLAGMYERNPLVRKYVDDKSLSPGMAAYNIQMSGHPTSERAVRRLRAKHALHTEAGPRQQAVASPEIGKGSADVTPDTVTFHGVVIDENLQGQKDWTRIFQIFNLDPENFDIVDDTVRISTWQQSKGNDDGTRDFIQLWSHSARFKKRSDSAIDPAVIQQWRDALIQQPGPRAAANGLGVGTYVILIADPQLGKKGTAQAVENWKQGVRKHIAEIQRLQASGDGPERVHVAWMGDESEGVANNYTNQPHTVELNQSQQLELDFDLRMWTLREVLVLGLPVSASSVISNHGEWTRNGSKDVVTTRNDNASTHIARQVKKAFESLEPYGVPHIEWTIGDDTPGIVLDLSGVFCYFSHGYIEKGKGASTEIRTKGAIERQILGNSAYGAVTLWFMAHYHHFYSQEFEGRSLFGLPALEAERSSEYMLHQYGVWSPSGMLGLIVGRDFSRGWSNLNVY